MCTLPLPVRRTTYSFYGDTAVRTDVSGQTTRTLTFTHDAAGRVIKSQVRVTPEGAGGTAVPETTYGFDPATGLPAETSSTGGDKVSIAYDGFGRAMSMTDATGNVSTVTYNADGQIATTHDGKGLITFTYNGVDAAGRAERRDLPTKVDTGGAGAFTGSYDQDGRLSRQVYPGGLTGTARYDNTGTQVALTYTKDDATWLDFSALPDNQGRVAARQGPGGSAQDYDYDEAGRLIRVTEVAAQLAIVQYGVAATAVQDVELGAGSSGKASLSVCTRPPPTGTPRSSCPATR